MPEENAAQTVETQGSQADTLEGVEVRGIPKETVDKYFPETEQETDGGWGDPVEDEVDSSEAPEEEPTVTNEENVEAEVEPTEEVEQEVDDLEGVEIHEDGSITVAGRTYDDTQDAEVKLKKQSDSIKEMQAEVTKMKEELEQEREAFRVERQQQLGGVTNDQVAAGRAIEAKLNADPALRQKFTDFMVTNGLIDQSDMITDSNTDPLVVKRIQELEMELASSRRENSYTSYAKENNLTSREAELLKVTAETLEQEYYDKTGHKHYVPIELAHSHVIASRIPAVRKAGYEAGFKAGLAKAKQDSSTRTVTGSGGTVSKGRIASRPTDKNSPEYKEWQRQQANRIFNSK
jgi:hypothetical protein